MSRERLQRIAVVGASAAGFSAVDTLRQEGYDGEIVVVGAEAHAAYERPPLSKSFLLEQGLEDAFASPGRDLLEALDVDLRLGTRAIALDDVSRTIRLSDGSIVPYDRAIIATGVRPRLISDLADRRHVYSLRTIEDAFRIRSALREARSVLIIGAGLLGLELAASCRKLDLQVTVVEAMLGALARHFGETVELWLCRYHREHGVNLVLGERLAELSDIRSGQRTARLSGGATVGADVVLVCIGSVPNTEWLADAGLDISDGVVCDAYCRASSNVFAAGDMASWHNGRFSQRMRTEHRQNATEQGMAAAANLLGANEAYSPIPYFWTDQYDLKVQVYGVKQPGSRLTVLSGKIEDMKFCGVFVHENTVTGVLGVNSAVQVRKLRGEIGKAAGLLPLNALEVS
jgi:NADPH-dependent 2,4-dienoyl-CoA reductase/sulfur reductase-like enzyme